MKITNKDVHVEVNSSGTGVNGILDEDRLTGIIIFGTRESDSRVFIHFRDDDKIRRLLIYSLMTTEELEHFTRRSE